MAEEVVGRESSASTGTVRCCSQRAGDEAQEPAMPSERQSAISIPQDFAVFARIQSVILPHRNTLYCRAAERRLSAANRAGFSH